MRTVVRATNFGGVIQCFGEPVAITVRSVVARGLRIVLGRGPGTYKVNHVVPHRVFIYAAGDDTVEIYEEDDRGRRVLTRVEPIDTFLE